MRSRRSDRSAATGTWSTHGCSSGMYHMSKLVGAEEATCGGRREQRRSMHGGGVMQPVRGLCAQSQQCGMTLTAHFPYSHTVETAHGRAHAHTPRCLHTHTPTTHASATTGRHAPSGSRCPSAAGRCTGRTPPARVPPRTQCTCTWPGPPPTPRGRWSLRWEAARRVGAGSPTA